jgi:hypothetical protein
MKLAVFFVIFAGLLFWSRNIYFSLAFTISIVGAYLAAKYFDYKFHFEGKVQKKMDEQMPKRIRTLLLKNGFEIETFNQYF